MKKITFQYYDISFRIFINILILYFYFFFRTASENKLNHTDFVKWFKDSKDDLSN